MQQTQLSQLKSHKTTSLFIQNGTQTTWEEHSERPIQTHTNVVTSSLHTGPFGICWPRHCLLKSTSAHVFTLDFGVNDRLAVVAVQKGICSASRRDAGHVSCFRKITSKRTRSPEQNENEIHLNRATITHMFVCHQFFFEDSTRHAQQQSHDCKSQNNSRHNSATN